MSYGDRLKKLREKRGFSQRELTSRLNINRSTYARYELNQTQPDYDTLYLLADYFDVTIDYIIGRSNHPKLSEKEDIEADEYIKELEEMLKNKPDDERKRLEERILAYARGITDASDD